MPYGSHAFRGKRCSDQEVQWSKRGAADNLTHRCSKPIQFDAKYLIQHLPTVIRHTNSAASALASDRFRSEQPFKECGSKSSAEVWHPLAPIEARICKSPPLGCNRSTMTQYIVDELFPSVGQPIVLPILVDVPPSLQLIEDGYAKLPSKMVITGTRKDEFRCALLRDAVYFATYRSG